MIQLSMEGRESVPKEWAVLLNVIVVFSFPFPLVFFPCKAIRRRVQWWKARIRPVQAGDLEREPAMCRGEQSRSGPSWAAHAATSNILRQVWEGLRVRRKQILGQHKIKRGRFLF